MVISPIFMDYRGWKWKEGYGKSINEESQSKGRSIVALPSTSRDENASRIVSFLEKESIVTIPRYDVDYVVTEYGWFRLKGKSLRQRGLALANIAHPEFREGLMKEKYSGRR